MYHLTLTVQTYPAHRVFSLSIYEMSSAMTKRLVRTYSQTLPTVAGGLFEESQDQFLTAVLDQLERVQDFLRDTHQ